MDTVQKTKGRKLGTETLKEVIRTSANWPLRMLTETLPAYAEASLYTLPGPMYVKSHCRTIHVSKSKFKITLYDTRRKHGAGCTCWFNAWTPWLAKLMI